MNDYLSLDQAGLTARRQRAEVYSSDGPHHVEVDIIRPVEDDNDQPPYRCTATDDTDDGRSCFGVCNLARSPKPPKRRHRDGFKTETLA